MADITNAAAQLWYGLWYRCLGVAFFVTFASLDGQILGAPESYSRLCARHAERDPSDKGTSCLLRAIVHTHADFVRH